MEYRELFRSVRQRPAVHGLDGSCGAVTAYVLGCDAAISGALLTGFREWLIVRLGDGNNLAWPALVARICCPGIPLDRFPYQLDAESNARAHDGLFELLDEFLAAREQSGGLARVFAKYIEWLRSQDWYRPDMLD